MSVLESKACCTNDAQFMRLQGLMNELEYVSPEDVIALMRKCATIMSRDLQDGELVLLNAMDHRDLETAAAAHYAAEAECPSPQSLR